MRCLFLRVMAVVLLAASSTAADDATAPLSIRGRAQTLHLYGTRGGPPVVVSSGDGGWMHLAPHVAELLASHGYFVVGFDVRAYLEGFTTKSGGLDPTVEPDDYSLLLDFATAGTKGKPLLVGISEGAGLSVMAAAHPRVQARIAGVLGLGLPETNELGWRWQDGLIYLTHSVPNEPLFSASAYSGRLAPVPLAAIHSTHDEYVPLADVQRVMNAARAPKRFWLLEAGDHSFSDARPRLDAAIVEALAWVRLHEAH